MTDSQDPSNRSQPAATASADIVDATSNTPPLNPDVTRASIAAVDEALREHLAALAHERDQAYQALEKREAELAMVQRIARVGGVEVDLIHGFKNRRSPEYLLLHGLPLDCQEDTMHGWIARIHPDDRDHATRHFLDGIRGRDIDYSSEYRIVRPSDGETRWIGVTAKFERDANGRALKLVGAHLDITERMLAQQQLRESEQRFRTIANSAPIPMWVTNLDGSREFTNQAYLDFFGMTFEEAVSFNWRSAIHPDDLPNVRSPRELTRLLEDHRAGNLPNPSPFTLEMRVKRKDGEWRWLRSESRPRFDVSGAHIGFIGVAHDITGAKQAEAELRRVNETLEQRIVERTVQLKASEAQMRAIFETSHLYQGMLDISGNLIHANRTALAGIRTEAADVLVRPFWDTPWFTETPGMTLAVREAFDRVLKGESARIDMTLNLPIGERTFDFTMRPVLDQDGKVTGAVPEAVDITERRQGEEALRQSQKMEAVGQLTGGVAHDFNNLLTIIRSATDFLRRRELPDDRRRRYIDAISDTVDRAAKLTGQLLAFARRQPLKPEIFNVGDQVESITQLIRPVVGGGIHIEVDVREPNCFALADLAQFETALINLAVNARDAMEHLPGGGQLTIGVTKVPGVPAMRGQPRRTGDFVAVSVTDTGMGIAADKLESIFEPFFTTKEVGKGTGLGLSQAFGFTRQSGGDIEVISAPDKGATFTIYLPQAAMPARTAAEATNAEPAATGRGHRVLVVEDNVDIGQFATDMLKDLGYKISWVTSAQDALDALARDEFAFDLIFSDIIMPGMNGVELATAIRERYPGLPVVLTSGYSNVLAANAHSGFELIQKPYSVEALSRTLRRAIVEKRQAVG